MHSVVIARKETGKVVAEVNVHVGGQNYMPSELQYHAKAWRIAVDDRLVEADTNVDDFTFKIVPVTLREAFSQGR